MIQTNLKTQIYEPQTAANCSTFYYLCIWNGGEIVYMMKAETKQEAQTFADSYIKSLETVNTLSNDLLNKYFNIQ